MVTIAFSPGVLMKASAPVLPPTFARHWAKELCSKENTLVQLKEASITMSTVAAINPSG